MSRKYFGTDGIRGRANVKITPELALKVGQAAGLIFHNGEGRHRVVIGKDTRLSGYMIESALAAGFLSAGMDVTLLGPLPTPAIAMVTRSLRADLDGRRLNVTVIAAAEKRHVFFDGMSFIFAAIDPFHHAGEGTGSEDGGNQSSSKLVHGNLTGEGQSSGWCRFNVGGF